MILGIMSMGSRFVYNFIIYRYQSGAALSVSKQTTSPINPISSIGVAAVNVSIVK
jgi:hypothetical protein